MNIINWSCGDKIAHFDLSHIDCIKSSLKNGEIQGLSVRNSTDISDKSISWLNKLGDIKILSLHRFPLNTDLSALKEQTKLEQLLLDVDRPPPTIDFSWFPWLKSISMYWRQDSLVNLELNNLDEIRIWKYDNKNLKQLEAFSKISHLQLVQAKCSSLYGISNFHNLNNLEIYYMNKLYDISDLSLDSLIFLSIENCKKIEKYSSIGKCKNLNKLYIHNSSPIESLSFTKNLKHLNSFRFINTDVLDGNLNDLFDIPDVYFTQKSHFSHKLNAFVSTTAQSK